MHIDMLHKLRGRGAKVWVIVESTQNLEVVLGLEKSDDPRGVLRTPCLTPVTYICDWAWDSVYVTSSSLRNIFLQMMQVNLSCCVD